MTTQEFIEFCEEQKTRNESERKARDALAKTVGILVEDVASIHNSRHATQGKLAEIVDEMRNDHYALEDQVTLLANSIQELVSALKGAFGGPGLVSQVAELTKQVAAIDSARDQGRGMARLVGWGAGLIAVAATIKGFFYQ